MNINIPFHRIASATDQIETMRGHSHGDPTVRFEDMIAKAAVPFEDRLAIVEYMKKF